MRTAEDGERHAPRRACEETLVHDATESAILRKMLGRPATPIGGPERVAHYDLLGKLATGGMATVYLGQARDNGATLVAVKSMRAEIASDETFTAMFLDEAELTSRIKHPNVVETLEIVSADERLLIVMEYVDGVSLGKLLENAYLQKLPIPAAVGAAILRDVLLGLHAAHELKDETGRPLNVVHRDISPQNVLVGVDGVARLLDFGIAKAASQKHETALGEIKGKLAYMPPEQQVAEPVDRRSDLWAAGVVLWETLVGRRLFYAADDEEIVRQVFEGRIEPASQASPVDVPPEVDRIVQRALAQRREDRWWDARQMAEALVKAVPPASTETVAAVVQKLGEVEIAQRAQLIYDLQEAHAHHMSVLAPEAQAVQDVLVTTGHGSGRDAGVRRILPSLSSMPPLQAPPAKVDRETRRAKRKSDKRRQLVLFAAMGIVLGLGVVGLLVVLSGSRAPVPEPPTSTSASTGVALPAAPVVPGADSVAPAPSQSTSARLRRKK